MGKTFPPPPDRDCLGLLHGYPVATVNTRSCKQSIQDRHFRRPLWGAAVDPAAYFFGPRFQR